jgi:hypothetical protein
MASGPVTVPSTRSLSQSRPRAAERTSVDRVSAPDGSLVLLVTGSGQNDLTAGLVFVHLAPTPSSRGKTCALSEERHATTVVLEQQHAGQFGEFGHELVLEAGRGRFCGRRVSPSVMPVSAADGRCTYGGPLRGSSGRRPRPRRWRRLWRRPSGSAFCRPPNLGHIPRPVANRTGLSG